MIENLLSADGYIILNKTLIKNLGLKEAIIIGELCAEWQYWSNNDLLDDDGYFYSTRENIYANTLLTPKQQRSIMENLKKLNIIEVKLQGIPATNYYKINEKELIKYLNNNSYKAKRGIVDNNILHKDTSRVDKMEHLDDTSGNTNNNNINNNINNNLKKEKINKKEKNSTKTTDVSSKKKTKTKKDKATDLIIGKFEEYDFSDNVKEKLLEFYEDRMDNNDYPANNQLTIMFNDLSKVSEQKQIDAINNSIKQGYKGIFINSDTRKKSYHLDVRDTETIEEHNERIADLKGKIENNSDEILTF